MLEAWIIDKILEREKQKEKKDSQIQIEIFDVEDIDWTTGSEGYVGSDVDFEVEM